MRDGPLRALVIEHQPNAPVGTVGDRAVERGVTLDVVRAADGGLPAPDEYDFVLPLGSGESVYDDSVPGLREELDLLRAADAAGVPVFGICFGAQMLAQALGGRVEKGAAPEIGWMEIDTDEPGLVRAGPWLVWHFDVFTPPPSAREIARSPIACQAFVQGPHLGVQFHPEATVDSVASWAGTYADTMLARGMDPDRVVEETRQRAAVSRRLAGELLDRFLARSVQRYLPA